MKLFVDSTDIEEIKEAVSWGVVDGVTTNPSLVMKSGQQQMPQLLHGIYSHTLAILNRAQGFQGWGIWDCNHTMTLRTNRTEVFTLS